jgi:hypothetical protein
MSARAFKPHEYSEPFLRKIMKAAVVLARPQKVFFRQELIAVRANNHKSEASELKLRQ